MPRGRPRGGHRTLTGRRERLRIRIRHQAARKQKAQQDGQLPSTSTQPCGEGSVFHVKEEVHDTSTQDNATSCQEYLPSLTKEELELSDFKQEELLLDCEDVDDQTVDETEVENDDGTDHEIPNIVKIKEEVIESPFETVICGSSVEIKREIEEESDFFGSSEGIDTQSAVNIYPQNEPVCTATDPLAPEPKRKTSLKTESSKSKKPRSVLKRCDFCKEEFFSSNADLWEHCKLKHPDASKMSWPKEAILSEQASTSKELFPSVSSGEPSKPPSTGDVDACDIFNGFFVSLKNIPTARRKAAKDKILELVNLIGTQDLEPSSVRFLVDYVPVHYH